MADSELDQDEQGEVTNVKTAAANQIDNKVKMIVEGLLLAAGRPLSLDQISQVFSEEERPDRDELREVMTAIDRDCDDRGFELIEVASGYRFQVKQELGEWVGKLWEEKPPRYTRALLETLALIAYRQPITRGDIEEIRGVSVSPNTIRTLLDREWIRVVGHRDVPGRPAMFATTKQFLDYFNLKNLQDLPPLSDIKDLEEQDQDLDLQEGLVNRRIIELPDEESVRELESEADKAELLAEEVAIELTKKPLDEILNRGQWEEEQSETEEQAEEVIDKPGMLRSLAKVIPLMPKRASDNPTEDGQSVADNESDESRQEDNAASARDLAVEDAESDSTGQTDSEPRPE